MNPSNVRFAELRQLLTELGFLQDTLKNKSICFRHAPSGTVFHLHHYKPDEFVIVVHLIMVRRILDERGLMEADEFERLLNKAPA